MMALNMKTYRVIGDLLIVISTTLLIGIIAFDKLSNTDHQLLTNIFLQSMHVFLLIGATLNLPEQFKKRQYSHILLTLLPLCWFFIAVAGLFIGFQFPVVLLLIFDFYLLYWFFYLLLKDLDQ
jgi:hypothetical protein